jgi:hypothetical protein
VITVSPFDGINRIRFKGSPVIGDCGIRIADFGNSALAIPPLTIVGLSAAG